MTLVYLCRKKRKMKMSEFNTKQIQERIYQNKINKGFNTTDIPKEFCYLYSEVAEAFEAFRKGESNFGEELADIGIFLLGIAELKNIDLGAEVLKKMDTIEKREYCRSKAGHLMKLYDKNEQL